MTTTIENVSEQETCDNDERGDHTMMKSIATCPSREHYFASKF
jgi:hypothetical protein